jgi:hypothetical protein
VKERGFDTSGFRGPSEIAIAAIPELLQIKPSSVFYLGSSWFGDETNRLLRIEKLGKLMEIIENEN